MISFNSNLIDVRWERIHLFLEIIVQDNVNLKVPHFYLLNEKKFVETEFEVAKKSKDSYLITINITNSGINRCIANGVYTILVVDGDFYSEVGFVGKSTLLSGWGRSFLYLNNTGNYGVSFMLAEYEESKLQVLFYNSQVQNLGHIPEQVNEINSIAINNIFLRLYNMMIGKRKAILRKVIKCIFKVLNKCFASDNRILFLSEQDDKLAFNMAAVYSRMCERNFDKKYKIGFSLHKATSKRTFYGTLKMLVSTAITNNIIVDDHIPMFDWLVLPANKKVIQVWHAGAGFKGVGYSRWGHCGCPGPFSCHRQYTYAITPSKKISYFFSEQFGILDEQVIPTGMPRMDSFINERYRINITEKLFLENPKFVGKKVILFAPTYRGQNRANAYYPYEKINFQGLYEYCVAENAIVLFKMHPWVKDNVPIRQDYREVFFDFNGYSNINDLFYITDVLITDYSSSIFEFLLMKKPMLFFAFDKEQYSNSRGFHREYENNIPGKLCNNFEDVLAALKRHNFEFYKVEHFINEYFDNIDENSTDRVIDWLVLNELPEKYQKNLNDKKKKIHEIRNKCFSSVLEN